MNRDQMLTELAGLVDELVEPHAHHEPVVDRDRHRNRVRRRVWTSRQDGLLTQLAAAAVDGGGDGTGGVRLVPGSRPPGGWEALARHAAITIAACRWCWDLRLTQRDTVEGNVRALVGAAATLDVGQLGALLADVRTWHHQAAVMTGWASPAFAPTVPCPVCEKPGTLRVNVDRRVAMCTNPAVAADGGLVCAARWSVGNIGVLADYIRSAMADQSARRVPVRSSRTGSGGWLAPPPP